MNFELISEYQPTGDQPEAIAQLTEGGAGRSPRTNFIGGHRVRQDFHDCKCN